MQHIINVHEIMEWMPVNGFDVFPQPESGGPTENAQVILQ